jgi:hypothetical protein
MIKLNILMQNNSNENIENGGFGMENKIITNQTITSFKKHLMENEKSPATIEKYMRDIRLFIGYVHNRAA